MINRTAILISTTKSAEGDVAAMKSFLLSEVGGFWSEKEILLMVAPKRSAVLSAISGASGKDYAFVHVVGSGEFVKGDFPWPEARLLLGPGETLTESELNPRNPRVAMLIDVNAKSSESINSEFDLDFWKQTPLRTEAIERYQAQITIAEAGCCKIQPVAVAVDSPRHWSAASILLQAVRQWKTGHTGVLSLPEAVKLAQGLLRDEQGHSSLEYLGGRRLRHFPFALSL